MKMLIVFLAFLFINLNLILDVNAQRLLPRFRGVKKTVGSSVSARLRGDRKALNVSFSNLKKARNVMYILMYQTNGKDEGVSGSIDLSSDSTTRELLFGTCSSGVCRYHTSITNMKLEVTSEMTSGKKTLKRFRIRV